MREIVFDTETTGLDPLTGDRILEVGCIELVNHVPSGRSFHRYVNPERESAAGALAVPGLDSAFLSRQPRFAEIVDELLEFFGDSPLVIHNAAFDIGFLNAELARIGRPGFPGARTIDTLGIARRRFPGAPASLDALCKRFSIDTSARTKHGALLDAELLAAVYLELIGGRQPDLGLASEAARQAAAAAPVLRTPRPPRPHAPTPAELLAHAALLEKIRNPLWTAGDAIPTTS